MPTKFENEYAKFYKELEQFSSLDSTKIQKLNTFLQSECDIQKKKYTTIYYLYHEYNFEEITADFRLKCVWNFKKELIAYEKDSKKLNLKWKIFLYENNPTSITISNQTKRIEITRNWLWMAKNGKWISTLTYLEYNDSKQSGKLLLHFNRHNGILEKKEELKIEGNSTLKEGWEYEKWKHGYEKCSLWKGNKFVKEDLESCELAGKLKNASELIENFGNIYVSN